MRWESSPRSRRAFSLAPGPPPRGGEQAEH